MLSRRSFLTLAGGAAASLPALDWAQAQPARKMVPLRGTLDIVRYGGNCPFDYGVANGLFAANGLQVSFDSAKGSQDAIARIASGTYDVGFADIATLIDFVARNPQVAPKAVLIVFNRGPQVICSLKKSKIIRPSDLIGKSLVSTETDAPAKLFPAFLKINGIAENQVTRKIVDIRLRDPMLVRGEVDAIIGFDYTTLFNLQQMGVAVDDISEMYFADWGLPLYGSVAIVSQPLLARDPDAVKGYARAVAQSWCGAVKNPSAAIKAIMALDQTLKPDLETARFKWLTDHEVVTPDTEKNGLGAYDPVKMQKTIDLVHDGLDLPMKPKISDVYDDRFLPPLADRRLA